MPKKTIDDGYGNPLRRDIIYRDRCVPNSNSIVYLEELGEESFLFHYKNDDKKIEVQNNSGTRGYVGSFARRLVPLIEEEIQDQINWHSRHISKLQRGLTLIAQTPPKST